MRGAVTCSRGSYTVWVISWLLLLLLLSCWDGITATTTTTTLTSSTTPKPTTRTKIVIGVDGGTESVRAGCFDAVTGRRYSCAACPYPTHHPQPGRAEQDPHDWWQAFGRAVRQAVSELFFDAPELSSSYEFCGLCIDTTCCSVVALDDDMEPLRPCLLWMDQRAARQTRRIQATQDTAAALRVHNGGPVSAEWMMCKALWLHDEEPEIWARARFICEYQDYINYQLTGHLVASACNATTRWHWDGEEAVGAGIGVAGSDPDRPGRPTSLYEALGIPELADKLPQQCLAMGQPIGNGLTEAAAQHLQLPVNLPVLQGGPDAFVGMIGLGCVDPGQWCLITGSSHLHCLVTANVTSVKGTWGAYRGAPLPGRCLVEGGQSSTGSLLRWARHQLFTSSGHRDDDNHDDSHKDLLSYAHLDAEAAAIPPGAEGLTVLETFQGSRTPVTDSQARGAVVGLTLSHTRAHIWRALLESVCFGTRACLEALEQAARQSRNDENRNDGSATNQQQELIVAGGVTRSEIWLQMHADVTGRILVLAEGGDQAPLLGCAILAAVGSGVHSSVASAVQQMVRTQRRVTPDPMTVEKYNRIYQNVYHPLADAVRPVSHAIHEQLRGGAAETATSSASLDHSALLRPDKEIPPLASTRTTDMSSHSLLAIAPSLLACDWSILRDEIHRCLDAGLRRMHVDVFDGVFVDSPEALTFGPPMVRAIRRSCASHASMHNDDNKRHDKAETVHQSVVSLDLHMCVDRPARYVEAMASATLQSNSEGQAAEPSCVVEACFIFPWEALSGGLAEAIALAEQIAGSGLQCGVSINPSTDVTVLYPLLETGLVDVVNVLAVEPCFGGQVFGGDAMLDKIQALTTWKKQRQHDGFNAMMRPIHIMVDGGINEATAAGIWKAGADVLVTGTFLFENSSSKTNDLESRARMLLAARNLPDIDQSRLVV